MEFVWYAATFAMWSPFLLHELTELTYTEWSSGDNYIEGAACYLNAISVQFSEGYVERFGERAVVLNKMMPSARERSIFKPRGGGRYQNSPANVGFPLRHRV